MMIRLRPFAGLALVAALTLAATSAAAQPNRNGAPSATVDASPGAAVELAVQAGGDDRNAVPGSGCSGYITNGAATAAVQWTGSGPLSVYATSSTDATLLVADPDGRWHCSDDANGSDPAVTIAQPKAGTYLVWVGTFEPGTTGATLHARQGAPVW